MNLVKAIDILKLMDQDKKFIYRNSDLRILFHQESDRKFTDTISRLVEKKVLSRVANGVFVFEYSINLDSQTIEKVALNIRRGFYNYLSLESALSEYGLISQMPINTLTIMTTGRKGMFETKWGNIEFIHTNKTPKEIISKTNYCENHELRFATLQTALKDLKSVNRNLHLISLDDYEEISNEYCEKKTKL